MLPIDWGTIQTAVIGAAIIGAGKALWTWITSKPGESFLTNLVRGWAAVLPVLALFVSIVALISRSYQPVIHEKPPIFRADDTASVYYKGGGTNDFLQAATTAKN
jgi:hypothetical protein